MIKLGTNSIGTIYFGTNKIGKAYLGSNLVFQSGGSPTPPLPYTPVEYIETDGTAYINTGIIGTGNKSAKLKILAVQESSPVVFLGVTSGSENSTLYAMCCMTSSGSVYFGYYFFYPTGSPSVADSIENETPFEVQVSLKRTAQSLGVKQDGESSFTSYSKEQASEASSTAPMYLFAGCHPSNGSAVRVCGAGSRVYSAKIYSDSSYSTLVFDGIPCRYNGEYGLWDAVSDSFFGNAAGSGAFSGPSNS